MIKIKNLYVIVILIVFTSLASQGVSAAQWVYGSLHQHTGYSTGWGYDGNPFTFGDDCQPTHICLLDPSIIDANLTIKIKTNIRTKITKIIINRDGSNIFICLCPICSTSSPGKISCAKVNEIPENKINPNISIPKNNFILTIFPHPLNK